jgi:hypothetical protein
MNETQIQEIADMAYGLRGPAGPDVEFAARSVARVVPTTGNRRNEKMTYWAVLPLPGKEHSCPTGGLLLKSGDGSCTAWADVFIWVLGKQGLTAFTAGVSSADPQNVPLIFVANGNWNPNPPLPPDQVFRWTIGTTLTNGDTIPGQGGINPPKVFPNHAIVEFGNSWYDPSYGLKKYDQPDVALRTVAYQNDNIEGVGKFFDPDGIPGSGDELQIFRKIEGNNPALIMVTIYGK